MRTTSQKNWILNPYSVNFSNLEFHSTCSEGLQTLLEEEVNNNKLTITSSNRGGVFFSANNWEYLENFLFSTRYSSQVGILIADLWVDNYDSLYEQALQYPWEKLFDKAYNFRIDSRTKDSLPDSRFSMYKLKDAILDRHRKLNLPIPSPDRDQSDVVFFLRSHQNHAIIELLLTTDSFTKRNYRMKSGEASLRENIAQAMLGFSGWNKIFSNESQSFNSILIDPFCGQGTILIEAALNFKKSSELNRNKLESSLVFQKLKLFHSTKRDITSFPQPNTYNMPTFLGIDNDEKAIELAKIDAKKAGVEDIIHFIHGSMEDLANKSIPGDYPPYEYLFIITDPPYGKRLGTTEDAKGIFEMIGRVLKNMNRNIHLTIITGDSSLLGHLRLKKDAEMSLKNAGLSSKIVNYTIYPK